jgi:ferredoxin
MQIRHRTLPSGEYLYSLEVKRDWENQVEYLVPPPVKAQLLADLELLALGCYRALGCRDVSRVDLRLKGGVPHFIEVNPLPGLSPIYGDLPILAGRMGWTHRELVLAIVQQAVLRSGFIWLCAGCYTCQERCPQGVHVAEVMRTLRNMAVEEGIVHPAFKAQAELIRGMGRIYEIEDFDNKKRIRAGLPELRKTIEEVKTLFERQKLNERLG